jgi:precorrin-6B methylase 2
MSLTEMCGDRVRGWVRDWPQQPQPPHLLRVLRFLAQWRSRMLANTYVKQQGARIWSGLFEGMDYVAEAAEGALIPRLLGVYEAELQPHLRAFLDEGLDDIIDVGCAEGYYAVGLARAAPSVTVHAHDIDPKAREACAALAARNGVDARVRIGGEFSPADFQAFAGRRVLVIVDAEGAELDVLQPALSPTLAGMKLIVETHDVYRAGALATLRERFAPTHEVTVVRQGSRVLEPPAWMEQLNELDRLIALWEWRLQPTPWLVMRPRGG